MRFLFEISIWTHQHGLPGISILGYHILIDMMMRLIIITWWISWESGITKVWPSIFRRSPSKSFYYRHYVTDKYIYSINQIQIFLCSRLLQGTFFHVNIFPPETSQSSDTYVKHCRENTFWVFLCKLSYFSNKLSLRKYTVKNEL